MADELKPAPSEELDALMEPVAWRVRQHMFELKRWGSWNVSAKKPDWGDGNDVEYQPLYPLSAIQSLRAEVERLREEVTELLAATDDLSGRFPLDPALSRIEVAANALRAAQSLTQKEAGK